MSTQWTADDKETNAKIWPNETQEEAAEVLLTTAALRREDTGSRAG